MNYICTSQIRKYLKWPLYIVKLYRDSWEEQNSYYFRLKCQQWVSWGSHLYWMHMHKGRFCYFVKNKILENSETCSYIIKQWTVFLFYDNFSCTMKLRSWLWMLSKINDGIAKIAQSRITQRHHMQLIGFQDWHTDRIPFFARNAG